MNTDLHMNQAKNRGSHLMADKAILNVAFSFGPIHLTVNHVTHPVSTEFFALGLSKTMLLSDDPSTLPPYFV